MAERRAQEPEPASAQAAVAELRDQRAKKDAVVSAPTNALEASIARKGGNSYYFAHNERVAVFWCCDVLPRRASRTHRRGLPFFGSPSSRN